MTWKLDKLHRSKGAVTVGSRFGGASDGETAVGAWSDASNV